MYTPMSLEEDQNLVHITKVALQYGLGAAEKPELFVLDGMLE